MNRLTPFWLPNASARFSVILSGCRSGFLVRRSLARRLECRDAQAKDVLAKMSREAIFQAMTTAHLTETVLALPEAERLALAREIIASLSTDEAQQSAINDGVRRMESIITGQTAGLTESQFRQALG